jgi:Tol biopolymer transport system component
MTAGCSGAPTIPLLSKPAPKTLTALGTATNIPGSVYFAQGNRIWRLRQGKLTTVTPANVRYAYPAVSAGGEVTAAAYMLNGESGIAMGGPDFSNLSLARPLPKNPQDGSLDLKPVFSPDGSRIAFMSDRSRSYADEAIWEGPVNGRLHQLSFPPDVSGGDDAPGYTADGTAVVFTAWRDGHGGLDRARVPVGRPVVVVKPTDHDIMDPAPGPGAQLAFTQRQGEAENIFVGAIDGTGARGVTTFNDCRQAAWSPDGKTLLFISPHAGTFDLYSVPVGGGSPTRLTAGADLDANSRPAWVAT